MSRQTIQSLMGHNINDGADFKVVGHDLGLSRPAAKAQFIEQSNADSVDVGMFTVGERQNVIQVQIVNFPQRYALEDRLRRWFKRGDYGDVVAKFLDDGDLYQLDFRVLDVVQNAEFPNVFSILLVSGTTNWRAVTADNASWSAIGTSSSHVLTVGGKDETRLSVTITGTAAPAGVYLYQDVLQLINPKTAVGAVSVCLNLNTAALVSAGKMGERCYDLRIFSNGASMRRWIDSPGTTYTNVWFNLNLRAGFDLPLYGGTAQVETATASGTITGAGNVQVVVTAAGMTGSPKTLNVAVLLADTAATWAAKVRSALDGDADVTAMFDVSGAGTSIVLKRNSAAANDSTLNIALSNGTCTGVSAAASSANTTAGELYSVASSGDIDTLEFEHSGDVLDDLRNAPMRFILVHGTEWFTVEKTATTLQTYQVNVVQRGALGTTEQGHSGSDVFSYIQYALVMVYGNMTAPNPSKSVRGYDSTKPVFDLFLSSNSGVAYHTSTGDVFYDPSLPNRPGSWAMFKNSRSINSKHYYIEGLATSGDPALGIKTASYKKNGSWVADEMSMGWILRDRRKFDEITATGRNYRTDTLWPVTVAVQASRDGVTWVTIFTESSPASPDVFTAWAAHNNVAVPDNESSILRLVVAGSSEKKPDGYQLVEMLTLYVQWTHPITITRLGEQDNYQVSLRVTNTASYEGQTVSDSFDVVYPLRLNRPLVIDGEEFEATYDKTNAHDAIFLDDESRTVLLRALPGNNTVRVASIDGHPLGTATIAASAFARRH